MTRMILLMYIIVAVLDHLLLTVVRSIPYFVLHSLTSLAGKFNMKVNKLSSLLCFMYSVPSSFLNQLPFYSFSHLFLLYLFPIASFCDPSYPCLLV